MSERKSIELLETGAGSALLISQARVSLSMKIHLERKSIIGGSRTPDLPGHKSRGCCSGRAEQSGLLLAAFSLDSGRFDVLLLLLFIVASCPFVPLEPGISWNCPGNCGWAHGSSCCWRVAAQAGFLLLFINSSCNK